MFNILVHLKNLKRIDIQHHHHHLCVLDIFTQDHIPSLQFKYGCYISGHICLTFFINLFSTVKILNMVHTTIFFWQYVEIKFLFY